MLRYLNPKCQLYLRGAVQPRQQLKECCLASPERVGSTCTWGRWFRFATQTTT